MDVRAHGSDGWSVGLDIGGSKVLGVALDASGAVRHQVRAVTVRGIEGVVQGAAGAVRALAAQAGVPVASLAGVGLGLPGVVDVAAGSVEHAVNLGIERRVALAALVSEGLGGVPVRLENDLNAAVVGAARFVEPHADDAHHDLAFLALGTGLAAGLLLDGRLRRGSQGAAGEIGHLTFVPDGLPCKCGQLGCLEQYASGSALDAAWPSRTGAPAPAEVFAAADAGDPAAVALRDQFSSAVAAAVRVLVLTCDVRHVVVGGGVSAVGAPLLDAVRGVLDRAARTSAFLESMRLADRVTLAPAGVPVGAVGAALVGRGEHALDRLVGPYEAVEEAR
ncbi:ROK family protein [Cellulomonas fimi]|uniref:ROK family protein n=1 Tax=Cellulomonas fimi (strain ATCC 484 / DSM 20113 / JCM 1341 / CCUG 24087 / LMG 16345 / NBRC 15513 / NCIMB 8980 / NCTC 7547 / NRS-133) TaxID=590998 RepID=F4H505_CELFA|nr:ROK family protein [Cellulomonas fimi]AEE45485.1 ROK family protein [Cellulomonas fimi ATCC 484]VEH29569.1 Glucokinase [Cellulomonas fimi]